MKGEEVPSNVYVLTELHNRLNGNSLGSGNLLHYFKVSCLKPKSLLYENEYVQIGGTATVIQDYSTSRNLLKLVVYYGNKLNSEVTEFRTQLTEGLNLNVVSKPQNADTEIAPSKQAKQQFLITFSSVPFSCLQLNCEGRFGGQYANFSLVLPTILTKFMEFKYVEAEELKLKWKSLENRVLKSETVTLDPSLARSVYDFKKYFGYLVDLKPNDEFDYVEGKKGLKLGGIFELDVPNAEYLLKIHALPDGRVVFQVATERQNTPLAAYLLQTLVFLFKK